MIRNLDARVLLVVENNRRPKIVILVGPGRDPTGRSPNTVVLTKSLPFRDNPGCGNNFKLNLKPVRLIFYYLTDRAFQGDLKHLLAETPQISEPSSTLVSLLAYIESDLYQTLQSCQLHLCRSILSLRLHIQAATFLTGRSSYEIIRGR